MIVTRFDQNSYKRWPCLHYAQLPPWCALHRANSSAFSRYQTHFQTIHLNASSFKLDRPWGDWRRETFWLLAVENGAQESRFTN